MPTDLLTFDPRIEAPKFGTKASQLNWLNDLGFAVPFSYFVPAVQGADELTEWLSGLTLGRLKDALAVFICNGGYKMAIRSSSTSEDLEESSMAGHFHSAVGLFSIESVIFEMYRVASSLTKWQHSGARMGIILQEMIDADSSGVCFTSHPLTLEKGLVSISSIRGLGMNLAAGEASGEDLTIDLKREPPQSSTISAAELRQLVECAKSVEQSAGRPMDIEWCFQSVPSRLILLQARPVSTYHTESVKTLALSEELIERQSAEVRNHPKLRLRHAALQGGIAMGMARLLVGNQGAIPYSDALSSRDPQCSTKSAVVLSPRTIDGKVCRQFVEVQDSAVASEPLSALWNKAASATWNPIIILQEVLDFDLTGVLSRVASGYLVEYGRGHFVPKGVVPTCTILLDTNGEIMSVTDALVSEYYSITKGETIQHKLETPLTLKADGALARQIQVMFSPLLATESSIVEFGVAIRRPERRDLFLIDIVETAGSEIPWSIADLDGVVSQGHAEGLLRTLDVDTIASLDYHYHNETETDSAVSKKFLVRADRPALSLLSMIHAGSALGFIFRECSILCHLAIVLREKGIPALISDALLTEGKSYRMDCQTAGLSRSERVTLGSQNA